MDPACLDEYAISLEKERWSNSRLGPTTSLSVLRTSILFFVFFLLPKLLPHFCYQMSHLDSFSKAQDGDHRFFQVCFTLSDNKLLLSPAVGT